MRKLLIILWIPVALVKLGAFQDPQIRVDVLRVNLLVTVTDKQGRFVTNLEEENFRVFEDGVLQEEITNFSRPTDLPLKIGMLIDTSASVKTKLEFEKEAAIKFFNSVLKRRDQALLVAFDSGVELRQDFTNRPSILAQQIDQLKAGGGTALLDAIYRVSEEKMQGSDVRKTLIVVSDGMDRQSLQGIESTIEAAHRTGVVIYTIGTNRFGADVKKAGVRLMERLADETGGRSFLPYSVEQLDSSFAELEEELRTQYSLTYTPTNSDRDGTFRKLRVRLRRSQSVSVNGLKPRYRAGYYASVQDGP